MSASKIIPFTEEELRALPPAVDLPTAGRAWGLGRTMSYQLARAGEFPCPVVPLGHRFKVTKVNLLRALGIEMPPTPPVDAKTDAA
jgi:predicted DNA-binding transcriptional regulator AlpA